MKALTFTMTVIAALLLGTSAQAARGHYSYGAYWRSTPMHTMPYGWGVRRHITHRHYRRLRYVARRVHHVGTRVAEPMARRVWDKGQIVAHPAGCPWTLFCGCGASIEAFGRSIRELWSVSSWFKFPRTKPADGMAVIWPGRHVAIIRQYHGDGTATLYDANSGGHLTRIHRRSIAGLVVVDPHYGHRQIHAGI